MLVGRSHEGGFDLLGVRVCKVERCDGKGSGIAQERKQCAGGRARGR